MEVHSHTHPDSYRDHRKKWTHYFWEFLMLFLAVFSGFLAENFREHLVERQRAKVYASNLYKELKKDTANLIHLIKYTSVLSKKYDTLCALSSGKQQGITNGQLYYYSYFACAVEYFSSSSSTVEQLKSSGNLRILTTEIALNISDYDRQLRLLESNYILFKTEYETINGLRLKIFDGNISVNLFSNNFFLYKENEFRDSLLKLNPPLINDDPRLMKEFIGWIKTEGMFWKLYITAFLEPMNKKARDLILLLKKEYRLE
jgi:hypothetical protein